MDQKLWRIENLEEV
jgi:hypothetical protein